MLPSTNLIAFLLTGIRGAVQAEFDSFFALLAGRTRLCRVITASAFSKARRHLLVNPFDPLNVELLRLVDEVMSFPLYFVCQRVDFMLPVFADVAH